MSQTQSITANGNYELTDRGYTLESALVVNAPAVIDGTIAIGYLDSLGTFVPYTDGGLIASESKVYNSGVGVNLVAKISGYGSTPFILKAHNFRSR